MLQRSKLGPLPFLLFIKGIYKTVANGTLRHFVDGTNILTPSKSVKKINREVNYNLRLINDWLKVRELCRNPIKADIIFLK